MSDIFSEPSYAHLFDLTYPDFNNTFDQIIVVIGILFFFCAGFANVFNIPFISRSGGLLSYSKFANNVRCGPSISSRVGMTLLYLPALCLGLLLVTDPTILARPRTYVTAIMITIHFGKRTFECNCVHRYSGQMPFVSAVTISTFYSLMAFICIHYASISGEQHDPIISPESNVETFEKNTTQIMNTFFSGIVLFLIGQLGNLYHHYLLATLRSKGRPIGKYSVPMGGLFSNLGGVACPHYLFELIGWYGIVIVTKHACILLFTMGMTVYLIDRSSGQNEWNRKKIDDYDVGRKNMIPYLL